MYLHVFFFLSCAYIRKYLQGYMVGSPLTDPKYDRNSIIPYAHGVGIISDQLYEVIPYL